MSLIENIIITDIHKIMLHEPKSKRILMMLFACINMFAVRKCNENLMLKSSQIAACF